MLTSLTSGEVQVKVLGFKMFLRLIRVPQNIMWERQRGYHNDFQGDYKVSELFMRCWWQVSQFILSNILFLFSRCTVNERGCIKISLIAATELDMIGGDYVFLAFEIDVAAGLNRQKLPFKWTTANFGMDFCSFDTF